MDKESINKLIKLIDDPDLKATMSRVSDNLDRTRRMKEHRLHPDYLKKRAQQIRADLPPSMKAAFPPYSSQIALILTGGGAKSSYQVGVYQVLSDHGLPEGAKLSAIAGTSAGALNAALFAGGSAALAEDLWSHLDQNKMEGSKGFFSPSDENDRYLESLIRTSGVLPGISTDGMLTVVTAFDYSQGYPRDFVLNGMEEEEKVKCLMASAAFPVALKEQLIEGTSYIDGGIPVFGSNMPAAPLYHLGFRRFIVVHCASPSEDAEIRTLSKLGLKVNQELYYNGASFLHIYPSGGMGGLLEGTVNFSHEFIMKNMALGKEDMQKCLPELEVLTESVGEYDEIHMVNGVRYRSYTDVLNSLGK